MKNTLKSLGLGASLIAFVAACGEPPPPPRSPPAAELPTAGLRSACPLGVKNAHVSFGETSTGAALTFTTTPEHLTELRQRAGDAAALHGTGKSVGKGHDGHHGVGGGRHGLKPTQLPPASARVEETAEGARLTITPSDPKDLNTLRAKLKTRTEKLMTSCE